MVKQYLRQQALAHLALDSASDKVLEQAGIRLWLDPPRVQLAIRGNAGDKTFNSRVKKICGLVPPVNANTVQGNAGAALFWMGPDEWLFSQLESQAAAGLGAALETALGDQHCLVSDVSSSRSVLGLAGQNARQVLMKATSLDVHPKVFGPGQCAQSAFARCHALLHPLSDEPSYHIYVHRSFTDYVYRWLLDACAGLESEN